MIILQRFLEFFQFTKVKTRQICVNLVFKLNKTHNLK